MKKNDLAWGGSGMSKRKTNSHILRQIAEEYLQTIAETKDIPDGKRRDLVTSLIRQWITYDGKATFFIGETQLDLTLGKNPHGKFSVVREPCQPGWIDCVQKDWKIGAEQLPEIIEQLNLGQSAEVISTKGIPLRLWVNPKESSQGIEPLVKQPVPPGTKRDYRKIAINGLERLGMGVEKEEMEALACSVVKQWQKYQGHAGIFNDEGHLLSFVLTEQEDGGCKVVTTRRKGSLEPLLSSLGFSSDVIPEVIARINLGQEVEFQDKKTVPSVLWFDPKERQVLIRAVAG